MTGTTGDRQASDCGIRVPGRVLAIGGLVGLGYLVAVGAGMWFLPDIAGATAPLVGGDPLGQRLAGWTVWGAFLLAVAVVLLRTARHHRHGTRTSIAGRWWTASTLAVLAVPGLITFGGRGGPDTATRDALDLVGPDFALGVPTGRLGAVAVVFVLGVLAVTLAASVMLEPGP